MEITANAVQTIGVGQNVLFTDTIVDPNFCSIVHRNGSGLVGLRGNTTQCRARFRVSFGGNIAVPTGETVGPISLALAIDGEPVAATTMISTPATVGAYDNVFSSIFINVPRNCCFQISVQNVGTIPVDVQNANLIVERVA